MEIKGAQSYKRQSVNTMTQEELLLVLFDELVMRLHRSDLALGKGDMELFETSVDRCLAIVRYLDDTLDRKIPISSDLHRLYEYFCYELNRVKLGRNRVELENIRPMIVDLRDTFREAAKNCAEGK